MPRNGATRPRGPVVPVGADPFTEDWLQGAPHSGDAGAPASARLAPRRAYVARPLDAWIADPSLLAPPQIVVPWLAVAGCCTLLSGREKSGKTTLTAQCIAAATLGHAVLGAPTPAPVTVLWYAVDERKEDTLRRFHGLELDAQRLIISADPRTVEELLEALEQHLAEYPAVDVVVVDTLSRLFAGSRIDANQSDRVEPILWRIVEALRRHAVAGVLLYHTNKDGRNYRGSTAIGATVDEILVLRRRGEDRDSDDFDDPEAADDGRRLLEQNGRNLRGRQHLVYADGRYVPFDVSSGVRDRILETLSLGAARSKNQLVKDVGGNRKAALNAVRVLEEEGLVRVMPDGEIRLAGWFREPAGSGTGAGHGTTTGSVVPTGSARGNHPGTTHRNHSTRAAEGGSSFPPRGGGEPEPPDVVMKP